MHLLDSTNKSTLFFFKKQTNMNMWRNAHCTNCRTAETKFIPHPILFGTSYCCKSGRSLRALRLVALQVMFYHCSADVGSRVRSRNSAAQ